MKDYFSHDYNSRNDKKLANLTMKFGLAGIGAYWCVVEMLYEEGGYLLLTEYDRITFELRATNELITFLIHDSNLFKNDGNKFWSESAIDRLKMRAEKSQKARESIEKRWNKINDTNVLRTNNERNTIKVKESKVNINKSKINIIEDKNWKNDFEVYKNELREAFDKALSDKEYILNQEKYNPGLDIRLSIEKSCVNFWALEKGWKHKKKEKIEKINWLSTFSNSIQFNKVYKQK